MNLFSLTKQGQLIHKATDKINVVFPSLLNKLKFNIEYDLPYQSLKELNIDCNDVAGAYDDNTQTIYLSFQADIDDLIHELGHVVHYQLLECREFAFSTVNKSEYAYKNFKEDFAEAFTDLCMRGYIATERDQEMFNIINELP